jgi:polysaccharide export outer membrane protein
MTHRTSLDLTTGPEPASRLDPLTLAKMILATMLAGSLAACSTLGASGPAGTSVRHAASGEYSGSGIQIIELDDRALARLSDFGRSLTFSEVFGEGEVSPLRIGRGDILDIAIWEAPPAVLFGVTTSELRLAANPQVAQSASIPQQMISEEGVVTIPFVGQVPVVGRTPAEIEREIVSRLRAKAHDPQVVVRLAQNEARTVTVLGEVAQSRRVPLTGRGERLLDALAVAGGVRHPVDKTTVQLARGNTTAVMSLERLIRDPAQNVHLSPDDVVTVLHQPFSFIALGAVSQSAEVPFEGSGLTLARALGRVGGLNASRADIHGVFIFRLEKPQALGDALPADARLTAEGFVPVIYRLNLSNPSSLFAMQDFAMRDEDVLYVSTAPGADLQRFVSTLSSVAFSTIAIGDALR